MTLCITDQLEELQFHALGMRARLTMLEVSALPCAFVVDRRYWRVTYE